MEAPPVVEIIQGRSGWQFAGFWRRFAASWIDGMVLLIVLGCLGIIALGLAKPDLESGDVENWSHIWFALETIYFVWLTSRGATLGKKAMGVRLIGPNGQPPGLLRAVRRQLIIPSLGFVFIPVVQWLLFAAADDPDARFYAIGIIALLNVAYFLLLLYDYLSIRWHPQRRTLHDRIGDTWVVRYTGAF